MGELAAEWRRQSSGWTCAGVQAKHCWVATKASSQSERSERLAVPGSHVGEVWRCARECCGFRRQRCSFPEGSSADSAARAGASGGMRIALPSQTLLRPEWLHLWIHRIAITGQISSVRPEYCSVGERIIPACIHAVGGWKSVHKLRIESLSHKGNSASSADVSEPQNRPSSIFSNHRPDGRHQPGMQNATSTSAAIEHQQPQIRTQYQSVF